MAPKEGVPNVTGDGGTSGMRLAIFAPSMAGGGAERGVLKLAEGLVRRGFEVDLVLAAATGPRMTEIPPGARVVDLNARRVATSLPALVRYLRRESPRAVVSVLDHANIVALLARRIGRYPGVVVVVEQNTLSLAAAHGKTMRDRLMPRFVARIYPWADYVVGVSAAVVDDLVRYADLGPDRMRVISNPIVGADLGRKAGEPVDHPWLASSVPLFVAAGRLQQQKDFPTLLHAFAKVAARRPAHLVVLGEGPERANLEALVQQLGLERCVQLPGATSNPYPYMARAVAFVLSSKWEGLPTVLVEALSLGVPVIATDCPSGPREILAGGKYGELVPVGDVGALARAMEVALSGGLGRPPDESWHPYEVGLVIDQYLELLVGKR